MSDEFPSRTEFLAQHRPYGLDCACGLPINSDKHWATHVEAAWNDACRIDSAEALDALPIGSVIRWEDGGSVEINEPMGWQWGPTAHEELFESGARLIWHPSWGNQ